MEYKRIAPMMTHLWSPMAAVTSCWEGKLNAQIVVAIGGASIVPSQPRVVVQIYKRNFSHGQIYRSGAFALKLPAKGPTSAHTRVRSGVGPG